MPPSVYAALAVRRCGPSLQGKSTVRETQSDRLVSPRMASHICAGSARAMGEALVPAVASARAEVETAVSTASSCQ